RGIADYVRAVDAFALHFGQQIAAHGVITQAARPAYLVAQARQADGNIGLGAGRAFGKATRLLQRPGLVGNQQHHRFAKSHYVQVMTHYQVSKARSCAIASRVIVVRSLPTRGYSMACGTLVCKPRSTARHGAAESVNGTATHRST